MSDLITKVGETLEQRDDPLFKPNEPYFQIGIINNSKSMEVLDVTTTSTNHLNDRCQHHLFALNFV